MVGARIVELICRLLMVILNAVSVKECIMSDNIAYEQYTDDDGQSYYVWRNYDNHGVVAPDNDPTTVNIKSTDTAREIEKAISIAIEKKCQR